MEIQITDDYVMTSDAYNFILNEAKIVKTGESKGKRRLIPVAYYSHVPDLVEGIIDRHIRASTTRTMKAFIKEYQTLTDEIRKLFKVGITGMGTMPYPECGAKYKEKVKNGLRTTQRNNDARQDTQGGLREGR